MLPLPLAIVLLLCPSLTLGNTEISVWNTNSVASLPALDSALLMIPEQITLSNQSSHLLVFNDAHTAHQLHSFDYTSEPTGSLSHWLNSKERSLNLQLRTIRLCWPATHPTDFTLTLYRPSPSTPDLLYLLITANYTGVPRPSLPPTIRDVPFTLLIEPVHLGGVPETAGPIIGVILALLVMLWAGRAPGRIADLVEGVARGGNQTLKGKGE